MSSIVSSKFDLQEHFDDVVANIKAATELLDTPRPDLPYVHHLASMAHHELGGLVAFIEKEATHHA